MITIEQCSLVTILLEKRRGQRIGAMWVKKQQNKNTKSNHANQFNLQTKQNKTKQNKKQKTKKIIDTYAIWTHAGKAQQISSLPP